MSTRRYVINETIANPSELRIRFRGTGRGRALLLPLRPQLKTGDDAQVMLTVRASGTRIIVSGQVGRMDLPVVIGRRSARAFELLVDAASTERMKPTLFDTRQFAPRPRRAGRRQTLQQHGDWRRVRDAVSHDARILDVSPRGAFLASNEDLSPGETIIFRTAETSPWMAGMVRWRGAKFGHDGVGVHIVFSREAERQSWNAWTSKVEMEPRP